jgi:hypothetical protein
MGCKVLQQWCGQSNVNELLNHIWSERIPRSPTRVQMKIVIGPNAIGLGSNTTRIGNSSTTRSHLDGILTVGVAANNVGWVTGPGSPEGVVTANPGSLYTNIGGGAGTTLYVKETGTGNTGWIAK